MRNITLQHLTFNEKENIILYFNIECIVKRDTENVLNYNN